MDIGIKRVDISLNKKKSVTNAKVGSAVRLSRTGRGSISNEKKNYPPKIQRLLDKAYESARDAANY